MLTATYDVKEEWSRALIEAFGPGGLIATEADDFRREHLLWSLVQLRCVNGRTGAMFTGDTEIAQRLGYNTKDHPGKQCRDVLTRLGFFTQHGKKGRAANLLLSAPTGILTDYPTLADSAHGDVITVSDTSLTRGRNQQQVVAKTPKTAPWDVPLPPWRQDKPFGGSHFPGGTGT
ncbi:hypothetical protein ACQEVG_03510 [Streptomyces sp. CA-135486]|uniref:hypothetical protein n=1 Tax=Streptomyces sp. CA-135486 TaxID=3240049 RepID=UPI003D9280DC